MDAIQWFTRKKELTRCDKQAARVRAIQAAYRKQMASSAREDAPNAGQIRGLGLLDAKEEDKDIHVAKVVPKMGTNK